MNASPTPAKKSKKFGQILAYGVLLDIVETERHGRPHLQCFEADTGCPFGTITAAAPQARLEPAELIVRTHSENEALRQPLLDSGLFVDTGKRIPSGFVELEIWKRTEQAQSVDDANPVRLAA